jgi:hypothetical protein
MKNGPNVVEIKVHKGIRNDVFEERFEIGDLAAATNIEIDETGKAYRRDGVTAVNATASHSLWASEGDAYVVQGGVLTHIAPSMALTPVVAVKGSRVRYVRVNGSVFWTDGIQSGVLTQASNRSWGIAPPPPLSVSAATYGDLLAGAYLCSITYVRDDSHESGAPGAVLVNVSDNGALSFPSLPVSPDPQVTYKRIYVSRPNGETMFLVGAYDNHVTSATITALPAVAVPLRTSFAGNPPPGQVVGYYKGRTFVAENNYLWYSRAYEYELFDLMHGYIGFPSSIRTFAATNDGIFIGTADETVFLAGDTPETFARRKVADYGTLLGTEYYVDGYWVGEEGTSGMVPYWTSTYGVCTGRDGGSFKNLSGGRYILPRGVSAGASLLKVRGGTPQFVTSIFG